MSSAYKTIRYDVSAIRFNGAHLESDDELISQDWYGGNWLGGPICELPDGKVLTSYNASDGSCRLSLVNGMEDILFHNNRAAINEYTFTTANNRSYLIPFVMPCDGEVYLLEIQKVNCDISPVIPCTIDLYKSSDKGLGQNWIWQSRLFTETHSQAGFLHTAYEGTIYIKGNIIIVPFMSIMDYYGYGAGYWKCLYSKDGGLTWATSTVYNSTSSYTAAYDCRMVPSIWESDGTYFMTEYNMSYTGYWFVFSSTDLINWTSWVISASTLVAAGWVESMAFQFTTVADSKNLFLMQSSSNGGRTFKRPLSPKPSSQADFLDLTKWEDVTNTIPFSIDDWYVRTYTSKADAILVLETSHHAAGSCFVIQGYGDGFESARGAMFYKINGGWRRVIK